MNIGIPTVFVIHGVPEDRDALSRRLASAGYRVCTFRSAERFLEEQDAVTPGCLLVDVALPGMSGLDLQRALIRSQFLRPVIFFTDKGDVQSSVRAMKAGAVDFLTKASDDARIFAAVDQALRVDREARRTRAVNKLIDQRIEALTPRERQVMEQVVFGRLNKQIAAELGTGEKTVKVHRARVMSKMGARSVAELVYLAARVGIEMDPTHHLSPALSANGKDLRPYGLHAYLRYTTNMPAAIGLREHEPTVQYAI